MNNKIHLYSASPRRKELLKKLVGKNFVVRENNFKESNSLSGQEIREYEKLIRDTDRESSNLIATTLKNAHGKAREALKSSGGKQIKRQLAGLILTADSLVSCNGEIIGKPRDLEEARHFLRRLSGQTIVAVTAFMLIDEKSRKELLDYELTLVYMDQFSRELIDSYVRSREPLGKAGGFSIQGRGVVLIKRIEGDFYNVVGLPLFRLGKALGEF